MKQPHFLPLVVTLLAICIQTDATEPPRPLIVAHRGLLLHAPENTLANFRACLELRVGFEFDVARTKDGHLVCIHDNTVDRTTNGKGKVAEMTLDEIRRLDAGSWFDPSFADEKVPTIEEVLKLVSEYRRHDVLIAVDLKADNVGQEVVRLAEKHKVLHRLLFIGTTIFEPKVRVGIKQASMKAQTAAVANNPDEFAKALAAPNADWVYFRYLPPKEQMDAVHGAGKRAFIAGATVSGNLPQNWQHAAEVGIDGILTDDPLELRAIFRQTPSNCERTSQPSAWFPRRRFSGCSLAAGPQLGASFAFPRESRCMARAFDQAKRREWTKRLERFRAAACSAVAQFCGQERAGVSTFYDWAKRVGQHHGQAGLANGTTGPGLPPRGPRSRSSCGFVSGAWKSMFPPAAWTSSVAWPRRTRNAASCQSFSRSRRGRVKKVRRAQILFKADANGPNWTDQRIAEAPGCRTRTIEKLRQRLVERGFRETLDGAQRESPPVEKRLSGEQETRIIATRLGSPPPGYANWTLRLLARKTAVG